LDPLHRRVSRAAATRPLGPRRPARRSSTGRPGNGLLHAGPHRRIQRAVPEPVRADDLLRRAYEPVDVRRPDRQSRAAAAIAEVGLPLGKAAAADLARRGTHSGRSGGVRTTMRVAIGRKNWLFAGNDAAAENHAWLWSLIASAERHGLDPQRYLTSV